MINNIQILRGLAALWVFFHHGLSHFKAMGLSFLPYEWIASYGFAGVDVFFVISGLVMAKTTENLEQGVRPGVKFLSKRCLRIYLGYWPIFIFSAILIWQYKPEMFETADLVGSVFLTNANMFELLVPPAWSLPFELYFYLLIGVGLLLKLKNNNLMFLILSIAIVAKVNAMDFGVSPILDLLLSHMIFEFLIGFYIWKFRGRLIKINYVFWLLLLVVSFYFATRYQLVMTVWRPIIFGVFSGALVILAMRFEGQLNQGLMMLLKPIGDASYTLYLFHFIVLLWFREVGLRAYLVENNLAVFGFIGLVTAVILLSYLLYRMIEKPLYQVLTKNIKLNKA